MKAHYREDQGDSVITAINESTENIPLYDYEHYRCRLQETLDQLLRLDEVIQDLLEYREYAADVVRSTLILPSKHS